MYVKSFKLDQHILNAYKIMMCLLEQHNSWLRTRAHSVLRFWKKQIDDRIERRE